MDFAFISDPVFIAGVVFGIVIVVGAFAAKYPLLFALLKKKIDEAEVFIHANESAVPAEFKGLLDDAKKALDDLKLAMEDDTVSYAEVYVLGLDFLAIVEEVKSLVMNK